MNQGFRHYLTVTGGYWAFTITDGAIRMLVVLYFHQLGYSPLEIAMLFLFYEFFGIVTNLIGGWLGARIGLNRCMNIGMIMQIGALMALAVPEAWLSVGYVMAAQAFSGIAKDLNKMSAKAGVKLFLPDKSEKKLFRWVAVLTGSKNALKGAGFFIGALLLAWLEFRGALFALSALLLLALVITWSLLPGELGKSSSKPKFSQVFSKSPQVNRLSAARFFLFGARDVWFVVGLPVFLYAELGWSFTEVGSFFALWVIGYGFVQGSAPSILRRVTSSNPDGGMVAGTAFTLAAVPIAIALAMGQEWDLQSVIVVGLALFGIVFAINSAVHSYLIVSWSEREHVSMNVGFYYMANAGGRLAGTVLSGWVYQSQGLSGCLWWSAGFVLVAALISLLLPKQAKRRKEL
ncbi:putative arabinose efflux permease, MFS family [Mariprofundus aestuarium]|uniref:Putative arabinose efflux permease, MFS family n=1 Tax=Mariprofundus aestuarium TaxID=1921086 RepID=A0A2K8L3M6_MARES|nr:organoarsenical effux MFS transporter ArsJ [Mariprofundus aestuarium]ATX80829.1 putative arabinose efflux permease, MFS family [Mariprofundus aestuarium]